MKNILGRIALCCALLLSSAGCLLKPKNPPVRVAVFTTDVNAIKILAEACAEAGRKHPGLKVKMENIPYGEYQNKISTLMAAGNAPDVISVEVSNFADLQLRDVLEDLTPYVAKDQMDMKEFYPGIVDRFSPGGKLYAIPSDTAPFGLMYYNQTLFDEAKIPYPKPSWNWTDFLAICKKLTKKDASGKFTRWGYGDPYGTNFDNFMLSNGGYYTDSETNPTRMALDSPAVMQAIKFRRDMIYVYGVSPSPAQLQSYSFGAGVEDMFLNGQVAMMSSGIWHTPRFLQKEGLRFDVVEFPRGPKGNQGWGTGGSGYAICKASKNKENAWIILKEITGEDITKKVASTGLVQPALKRIAESDVFLKAPGPANKKILLKMPLKAHYGPYMKGWPEIQDRYRNGIDPIWLGTKKPEEVLPKLNAEINKRFFGKK